MHPNALQYKCLPCLLCIKPSVIFSYRFARDVSTVGENIRDMPVLPSSSIVPEKVLRSEDHLKKRNEHKISFHGGPLPRPYWLQPHSYSTEIHHVIPRKSLTACPFNPAILQLMKRSSFPRSGNTGSRNKASRQAVSALGFNRHWTSQTLR